MEEARKAYIMIAKRNGTAAQLNDLDTWEFKQQTVVEQSQDHSGHDYDAMRTDTSQDSEGAHSPARE